MAWKKRESLFQIQQPHHGNITTGFHNKTNSKTSGCGGWLPVVVENLNLLLAHQREPDYSVKETLSPHYPGIQLSHFINSN